MKNKKACEPEGISAELIKNTISKLTDLITNLFNRYVNGELEKLSVLLRIQHSV